MLLHISNNSNNLIISSIYHIHTCINFIISVWKTLLYHTFFSKFDFHILHNTWFISQPVLFFLFFPVLYNCFSSPSLHQSPHLPISLAVCCPSFWLICSSSLTEMTMFAVNSGVWGSGSIVTKACGSRVMHTLSPLTRSQTYTTSRAILLLIEHGDHPCREKKPSPNAGWR